MGEEGETPTVEAETAAEAAPESAAEDANPRILPKRERKAVEHFRPEVKSPAKDESIKQVGSRFRRFCVCSCSDSCSVYAKEVSWKHGDAGERPQAEGHPKRYADRKILIRQRIHALLFQSDTEENVWIQVCCRCCSATQAIQNLWEGWSHGVVPLFAFWWQGKGGFSLVQNVLCNS